MDSFLNNLLTAPLSLQSTESGRTKLAGSIKEAADSKSSDEFFNPIRYPLLL